MSDSPRTRAELRERSRRRASRRRSSDRKGRRGGRGILRKLLLGLLALFVLGCIAIGIAYAMTDIPKANDRAVQQASVLYYSDGKTEMDRIAKVNRESVPLKRVPKHVQEAFLAAEDRSFYENRGISPRGIGRAVVVAVKGGEQQGGSTITQQYVKNYFLTQDQTISRKAKEILISVKIDRELSKEEILENYLNTIYFGRNADGIQTASQAYFGKDVQQLTPSEGALLASVIRGPSLYDPGMGSEQKRLVKGRWNYVLDGMVEQGWMTPGERAKQKFPKTTKPKPPSANTTDVGFITEEVRTELRNRLKLSDADIDRGGFKIVTTIDKKMQKAAVSSVKEHRPTGKGTSDLHIGLVSIQPNNGAIRAMYGGDRFTKGKYGFFNTSTDGAMQAGSTMKPFTMLAALDRGIPLSTTYSGSSPWYHKDFAYTGPGATDIQRNGGVVNFANASYGPVNMRTATQKSVNTYYAQLNVAATPKATAKMAEASGVQGYNGEKRTKLSTAPSNVFGIDSVRVVDMANAYATIAAEGRRARPYLISSVKSVGEHELDYKVKLDVRRAFPQDVARDAINAMSGVGQPGGTAYPTVANLGRPVGGKTGTTSNNYAAWFDGFTPGQLATAVGMYKGDGSLIKKNQLVGIGEYGEITGGTIPAQIWTDFMIPALEGEPIKQLPPLGNVTYRPQSHVPSPYGPPTTTSAPPAAPAPTSTSTPRSTSTSSSSSSSKTTSKTTSSSSSSTTSKTSATPTSTPRPTTTSSTPRPTPPPTSSSPPKPPSPPTTPSPTMTQSGSTP